ncbi:PREDICTED: syndetin isoform X1 [Theobroma cacao]|uniref:Syndetin isoform X1 n=2 Tax=Theobroma cacao TaxID=3641 RepID=A0AB32USR8_THECC|nr:PREDICTED: syndetin isoform X1 [Theobroma cacao]
MQQPNLFPFGSVFGNPFLLNGDAGGDGGDLNDGGFESSRVFFLLPFLLFQGGGMDLSKVGEKILSSVRSARSLGLLPSVSSSDRPEVPARAAAAAAVARALAGLPPHQRYSLPSSSEELRSIYGSRPQSQVVEELEEAFYEEDFDPIKHILEHIPSEENELEYFEKQATLRLAQLDRVAERLSRHVMEHHEVMVKGMNLVRELEIDLKVANVICMNGRRHLTSSINEVSRDLVVNTDSKKKQALMDLLPVLAELLHAQDMQAALESLVEEGNYCKAFQVLSEYLQLLDSVSELSAIQEMSRGVEVWLGRTLQKLDSLLLGVCQEFKEEGYLTVVDAYALIGDVSGLAEKIQSFFMQEVISETHSVLKSIVHEDQDVHMQSSRLTYSDLCLQIPESKFRQCLLRTLAVLFKLMCSYHEIMGFQLENKVLECPTTNAKSREDGTQDSSSVEESRTATYSADASERTESGNVESHDPVSGGRNDGGATSSSGSPWYQLRKEAIAFVSQTLQRGRKNLWQLTTSRVSVLLSSSAASSTSIHQFLKNYEDLNTFILAGEAFCGVEAVEFRQKLKGVCENYFTAFHRQNISALKMVLEKETWLRLPPETVQIISFAGLVGDGAPLIAASDGKSSNARVLHTSKSANAVDTGATKSGFSPWLRNGNPFLLKVSGSPKEAHNSSPLNGATSGEYEGNVDNLHGDIGSPHNGDVNHINGSNSMAEEENEDLLADFIDEDSQLPSRISKSSLSKTYSSHCSNDEFTAQTGSSLCLLRSMDKYARLMQKLEIVNVEFFKGICQLFEMFFYYIFEAFGQQNMSSSGKGSTDSLTYRLKTALSRITQDCDQWIKTSSGSPLSPLAHTDVTPTVPQSPNFGPPVGTSFGLKERCAGADTVALVARILHRSRTHLQSLLLKSNTAVVEDFFVHLVDSVPDLTEHIHRTTARILLHINGYVDRIANAKWELKELGMEHNGYVDLLLGEFKHYKTRLAHGGIHKEVQDLLLGYGLEIVAETLIEGLSRVKRCTDEGRALMSLDLQVLINGLQHFVSINVKPKLQIVEAFIKAYYLPETEYIHWARAHPEYSKNQIVGLINLVATMKGWKRKTRLEVLEKIE